MSNNESGVPPADGSKVGDVMMFNGESPPEGFVIADGVANRVEVGGSGYNLNAAVDAKSMLAIERVKETEE